MSDKMMVPFPVSVNVAHLTSVRSINSSGVKTYLAVSEYWQFPCSDMDVLTTAVWFSYSVAFCSKNKLFIRSHSWDNIHSLGTPRLLNFSKQKRKEKGGKKRRNEKKAHKHSYIIEHTYGNCRKLWISINYSFFAEMWTFNKNEKLGK